MSLHGAFGSGSMIWMFRLKSMADWMTMRPSCPPPSMPICKSVISGFMGAKMRFFTQRTGHTKAQRMRKSSSATQEFFEIHIRNTPTIILLVLCLLFGCSLFVRGFLCFGIFIFFHFARITNSKRNWLQICLNLNLVSSKTGYLTHCMFPLFLCRIASLREAYLRDPLCASASLHELETPLGVTYSDRNTRFTR